MQRGLASSSRLWLFDQLSWVSFWKGALLIWIQFILYFSFYQIVFVFWKRSHHRSTWQPCLGIIVSFIWALDLTNLQDNRNCNQTFSPTAWLYCRQKSWYCIWEEWGHISYPFYFIFFCFFQIYGFLLSPCLND